METISYEEFKKRYGTVGLAQAKKPESFFDKAKNYITSNVANSFKGGIQQIKTGAQQINPQGGNNPFRGGLNVAGGLINTAFSPIAPVTRPIAKGVEMTADKISDNPSVQRFANTGMGQQVARTAEDVANLANIAGTVGSSRLAMQGMNKLATRTARPPSAPRATFGVGGFDATKIESQARNIFQGVKDTATMAYDEAKRIPDRIQTNVAEKQAFNQRVKELPTPASQKAAQDGVDIGDIETVLNLPKEQRGAFKGLANTVKDFASGKTKTNPIEVVGRPITQRLKDLEKIRGQVGKKLGEVADTLGNVSRAETFDAVFNKLKQVPGLEGLTVNNKGALNFSDTVLTTLATKADRRAIQAILNESIKRGTGKGKHLLRQELFEILGGKKKSLANLTDTQEKAFNAVRDGLSDLLESKNPQYKKLSNDYRKIIQPLQQMRKMMKLSGVSDDILDMKAGLLARRLTSMAASNPEIRGILNALDNATKSMGKTKLSVEALQDFYNILEKYYDIAPKTGFQAQVTRGIESASSIRDFAAGKLREFAGETPAVRQKALENLLDEIFGEEAGKGGFLDNPLIQEARKYKSAEEFVNNQNKLAQLDKVNKSNPMSDDYHTGIRSVEDIKTFKEAFNDPESFVYPDFTKETASKALRDGKVTIYSSKPLHENTAQFVTPSKMQASDYAGSGKVYSKTVNLDDVAWINGDEGQLTGSSKSQLTDIWNKANGF